MRGEYSMKPLIIGIAGGRLVLDKKSSEVTNEDIEFIYGGAYEKYE